MQHYPAYNVTAFKFDNRLGNPPIEVRIDMVPRTHPISLPMYGALSQKREVIDTQIDKWLEQEVTEPSKSPWASLVIIMYQMENLDSALTIIC